MLKVVCVVFQLRNGDVFITQRPKEKSMGLKWEFPGGKVEPGESEVDALRREIEEELSFVISQDVKKFAVVEHEYDFGVIQLAAFLHICSELPEFVLNEHITSRWLKLDDWKDIDWAPADIPIVKKLRGN